MCTSPPVPQTHSHFFPISLPYIPGFCSLTHSGSFAFSLPLSLARCRCLEYCDDPANKPTTQESEWKVYAVRKFSNVPLWNFMAKWIKMGGEHAAASSYKPIIFRTLFINSINFISCFFYASLCLPVIELKKRETEKNVEISLEILLTGLVLIC